MGSWSKVSRTSLTRVMRTRNPVPVCRGYWEKEVQYMSALGIVKKESSKITNLPWAMGRQNPLKSLRYKKQRIQYKSVFGSGKKEPNISLPWI